jgi:hypothetical protein
MIPNSKRRGNRAKDRKQKTEVKGLLKESMTYRYSGNLPTELVDPPTELVELSALF